VISSFLETSRRQIVASVTVRSSGNSSGLSLTVHQGIPKPDFIIQRRINSCFQVPSGKCVETKVP
jgi:hypothetical protein